MRRICLVLAIALFALGVPATTLAAPFPAVSAPACARAGGTYSIDTSVDPIVKSCVVSLHNGAVTLYYGSASGYVVEVSTSDDVNWYFFSDGEKTGPIFFGGALGVTNCWLDDVEVPNFLSEPNCVPTTPIP